MGRKKQSKKLTNQSGARATPSAVTQETPAPFPPGPTALSEQRFRTQLFPFMEKKCHDLSEQLKEDHELATLFKKLRLVYVDNGQTERKYYLYVTPSVPDHLFQRSIPNPPAPGIHGSSSGAPYTEEYACLSVLGGLRSAFTDAILSRARPEHLAKHIERLLRSNYSDITREHTDRYYLFRVQNLEFSGRFFFISAYRLNLVIPIVSTLDALEIIDHSADCKKILLTTQKDDTGFSGFDEKLDRIAWQLHFSSTAFTDDPMFFQDLVRTSLSSLFQAMEQLRDTGSMTVYEMKKELALLDMSDGKILENYMERFLRLCFSPSYDEFDLRQQVANRGRINIRDFIISNISSLHPFLSKLERKGVEFLLFDAKNYSKELAPGDLDAFRRYLEDNSKFGNFGVILSRKGMSFNCEEHLYRSLISKGPIILVLHEEDLMAMLDRVDQGRPPVDVLQERYVQLVLQA
jgi:hypothetical protein